MVGLARLDAVRGASEDCDQNVCLYIAGANGACNKEMRRLCMSYMVQFYPKLHYNASLFLGNA